MMVRISTSHQELHDKPFWDDRTPWIMRRRRSGGRVGTLHEEGRLMWSILKRHQGVEGVLVLEIKAHELV
jgi:hypothetical protein